MSEQNEHELRDLFAAHALQGLLAADWVGQKIQDESCWELTRSSICLMAYQFAEVMLATKEMDTESVNWLSP